MKQLAVETLGDDTASRLRAMTTGSFSEANGQLKAPRKRRSSQWLGRAPELAGHHANTRQSIALGHWPNVIVCHDFSYRTVKAVLHRRLAPQCRVLLCIDRLPSDIRMLHRVVLAGVDAVLVQSDASARAVHEFGVPASRIVLSASRDDLKLFAGPIRSRPNLKTIRVINAGDLEPEAGVADFLPCVVAWADRNPRRVIEISWFGEGCLRGVLEAQPIPANVQQRFPGRLNRDELAAAFREHDILAMPVLADPWSDMVLEALTAQLPVLGSSRSRTVVDLITHGLTGWIFDPFEPGAMIRAVDTALDTPLDALEQMRAHAAARPMPSSPELDERIRRAMRMSPTGPSFDAASLGLAQ